MTRKISYFAPVLLVAVMIFLTLPACPPFGSGRSAPGDGMEAAATPTAPPTPTPPPPPELKILKISGAGAKNKFRVKLQWNGDEPTIWRVERWTLMQDITEQTQSMLVLNEQAFEIRGGEPRIIYVPAICINPEKPPARHLLVDYEGAPVYLLTTDIPDQHIRAVIDTIEKVEAELEALLPRLRFIGNSYELREPQPNDELHLSLVVWDLSGEEPYPYIREEAIEAALIVAAKRGMTYNDYVVYLQRTIPGVDKKDALRLIREVQPTVNKLLTLAGLAERLTR